jgi:hypothetical protein
VISKFTKFAGIQVHVDPAASHQSGACTAVVALDVQAKTRSLRILFMYDRSINAVLAQGTDPKVTAIMSDLYPGDTGEQCPHTSCERMLNGGSTSLPSRIAGKPYKCVLIGCIRCDLTAVPRPL